MMVLRKEHYAELEARLRNIREQFPMRRADLEYGYESLVRDMRKLAEPVETVEIADGKRYGILEFSPWATGFAPQGRELKNHGDIYITLWLWISQISRFFCSNAFGSYSEKSPAQVRLLVELP